MIFFQVLEFVGQAGEEALDWLLGSDNDEAEFYPIEKLEYPYDTIDKGDAQDVELVQQQLPPLAPGQYLSAAPIPAHYVTKTSEAAGIGGSDLGGATLSYDPDSKTLYIDRESADLLSLRDGDTLPVPNDILSQVCTANQVCIC